jgi:hypothetical protein
MGYERGRPAALAVRIRLLAQSIAEVRKAKRCFRAKSSPPKSPTERGLQPASQHLNPPLSRMLKRAEARAPNRVLEFPVLPPAAT